MPRGATSKGAKKQRRKQAEVDRSRPPGGLSEAELAAELRETGRWSDDQIDVIPWKDKITLVDQIRAEAEIAANPIFLPDPETLDYLFDGHAGTGPSGAERWMTCTASLGASRAFLETLTPNQQVEFAKSSEAARQGATAHAAAEAKALMVLGEITAEEMDTTLLELSIEPENGAEAFTEEMEEFISEYVDLIKQYHDSGRVVQIEQRVSAVVPLTGSYEGEVYENKGSADAAVLPSRSEKEVVVADLKYGVGIDVDVEHNPQTRIYALGVLTDLADDEGNLPDIERVTYHIVQPRLGGIKTWSEPLDDLLTWRDEVLSPALTAALYGKDEGATFVPTEAGCQFCPARGTCPALAESLMAAADDLFDAVVQAEFEDGPGAFPETESLSDERLGALLTQINGLSKIKDDLKAEAQRRLHRGGTVPGFKLVSHTPKRKWKPEAAEALDPDGDPTLLVEGLPPETARLLWTKKILTPKQALLLLAKEGLDVEDKIAPLIDAPPKVPLIAPENDRRKTWEDAPPEAMFPDHSEEEGA